MMNLSDYPWAVMRLTEARAAVSPYFALPTVDHAVAENRKRERAFDTTRLDREIRVRLLAEFGAYALPYWEYAQAEHTYQAENTFETGPPWGYIERGQDNAFVSYLSQGFEEWRQKQLKIEQFFASLRAASSAPSVTAAVIERALRAILEERQAIIGSESFVMILAWYLDDIGAAPPGQVAALRRLARQYMDANMPSLAAFDTNCAALSLVIVDAIAEGRHASSSLEQWRTHRPASADRFWERGNTEVPLKYDGMRRLAEQERDDAMLVALDACRESAARGETLTFDLLKQWHSIAMGGGGASTSNAETDFAADPVFLTALSDAEVPPAEPSKGAQPTPERAASMNEARVAFRAARVYLDICFTRPFTHGNARVARLALDHVLTRNRRTLHAAEPLFSLRRDPTNPDCCKFFWGVVDFLSAST